MFFVFVFVYWRWCVWCLKVGWLCWSKTLFWNVRRHASISTTCLISRILHFIFPLYSLEQKRTLLADRLRASCRMYRTQCRSTSCIYAYDFVQTPFSFVHNWFKCSCKMQHIFVQSSAMPRRLSFLPNTHHPWIAAGGSASDDLVLHTVWNV